MPSNGPQLPLLLLRNWKSPHTSTWPRPAWFHEILHNWKRCLGNGIGAVLMQDNRPIAYFSKQLHGRHLLSTYEEEMMAPYLSVQKWRHYLLGKNFLVKTDHASLKHLWKQRILTTARHRWLINLLEYDFAIEYKKGIENNAADALSGVNESNYSALAGPTLSAIKCQAISAPTPSWLATIIKRT